MASIENFTFQDGTTLPSVKVAYKEINSSGQKTAVVVTCYGGRIDETLNFTDGALKEHRVIVVALFGNGESSSPSNEPRFPKDLDYRDCINAQYRLLTEHLHIKSVDVVVGFSMGGQAAYYWAAMYPDYIKNSVSICSSARTSGHNWQFLEGPKAALVNSVDYVHRDQAPAGSNPTRGQQAFALAYSAWLTSAEWFDNECYKEQGHDSLAAWNVDVLDSWRGWTVEDMLIMLGMWQKADVSVCIPGSKGDLDSALAQIKPRMLVMPCRTDQYFTPQPSEREVKALKHGTLAVIPSVWGHIGGGGANPVDTKWMDDQIRDFLKE